MELSTTALRIARTLSRWPYHPATWPAEVQADCERIAARYEELRGGPWGFGEAKDRAEAEWVEWVLKGGDAD